MEGIFKKVLNFPSSFPPPRRMDEKVLTLYFIRGYLMSFQRYEECSNDYVVPRFHSRVSSTRRRVARCIPLPFSRIMPGSVIESRGAVPYRSQFLRDTVSHRHLNRRSSSRTKKPQGRARRTDPRITTNPRYQARPRRRCSLGSRKRSGAKEELAEVDPLPLRCSH